jgi:hypothetical protein
MKKLFFKILSAYLAFLVVIFSVGLNLCEHICTDCNSKEVHFNIFEDGHQADQKLAEKCHCCTGSCVHHCEDTSYTAQFLLKIDSTFAITKNVNKINQKILDLSDLVVEKVEQVKFDFMVLAYRATNAIKDGRLHKLFCILRV